MRDRGCLRKAGLALRGPHRYLRIRFRNRDFRGAVHSEAPMVAIGIIFSFLALYGILNLIEFKRFD